MLGFSPLASAVLANDGIGGGIKAEAYHRHMGFCSSLKQAADQSIRNATSPSEVQTTLDTLTKDHADKLKTYEQ